MLCLCPAFPAISIPTRRVHITKSKGECKTQRHRSEEGSGSYHGGRGYNHSHHLPKSVLPHCSHGQTSPVDTEVQHYPRNHTVPWLSLETPVTTAPITDTPLPAQLLPNTTPGSFPRLSLPTCPTQWVTHRSFLLQQLQQHQRSPGELCLGSCQPGWADGKSGWQRSLARENCWRLHPTWNSPIPSCRELQSSWLSF